jgi:hypothetical protein
MQFDLGHTLATLAVFAHPSMCEHEPLPKAVTGQISEVWIQGVFNFDLRSTPAQLMTNADSGVLWRQNSSRGSTFYASLCCITLDLAQIWHADGAAYQGSCGP